MNPVLVTGFGPFPGMPRNPSAALARAIGAALRLRGGPAPRILVLRTAYASIPGTLLPALAERPAAVLMLGVASRAKRIRVETRARNRASRLYPDASGRTAARLDLDPDGPASRRSSAAAQALATLRRHGLDARPSNDAGRYLCNASYYAALAADCPALFVHIPPVPRTARPLRGVSGQGSGKAKRSRQAAALAEIARAMRVRARHGR
ncbi:peptidase C15 [Methylobacterium dankookense]|uniref:Pyrrolidone-carboxylate peptidase n=1 Tax=Methylobacterium dankookense TaxID=560405 RepID=A0A564FS38_9HYPH|nr:peptidase C15 [Methylobacterium dankookense]GJD57830.1 Pyrrolidone-carboxylate peptidase [Methylobacterium dankookense]VUF10526.1 Pyrrolidone-carboxylate peptidase [Methylobacterium dankookense]